MHKPLFLLAIGIAPSIALGQTIEGKWTVRDFVGEAAFIDPSEVIGTVQIIDRGFAEGAFYECNLAGQYLRYTTYTVANFLASSEFKGFQAIAEDVQKAGSTVFVHNISCNGDGSPGTRQKLYPIVTVDDASVAWYPFEGGIFTLEISQ